VAENLTPLAAAGFAVIMVAAIWSHARLREPRNVALTTLILLAALTVTVGRFAGKGGFRGERRWVPRGSRLDQDAFTDTSSRTKLVCRDESSVPLNDSVTVWPANEDTSKVLSVYPDAALTLL
jgi:DoxX-like family